MVELTGTGWWDKDEGVQRIAMVNNLIGLDCKGRSTREGCKTRSRD